MEKKGELLNQLAIISDLLEKANINTVSTDVNFYLNETDYYHIYDVVENKYGIKMGDVAENFTVTIGFIDFIFNKNNA